MSRPPAAGPPYTEEQVNRWLSHLAHGMHERGQTIFLIEQLQPGWLRKRWQLWVYILSSRMLETGLFFVIFIQSISFWTTLSGDQDFELTLWGTLTILWEGFLLGAIIGLIDAMRFRASHRAAASGSSKWWRAVGTFVLYWSASFSFLFYMWRRDGPLTSNLTIGMVFASLAMACFSSSRIRERPLISDIQVSGRACSPSSGMATWALCVTIFFARSSL